VVLGLEGAGGARGGLECFEDGEKLVVTHLRFHIGFFNPLGPNFRLSGCLGLAKSTFLPETNKFQGSKRPGFAFKFA